MTDPLVVFLGPYPSPMTPSGPGGPCSQAGLTPWAQAIGDVEGTRYALTVVQGIAFVRDAERL